MRLLATGLAAVTGLLLAACDDFPENAGVTLSNGEPQVVFRACSESERLLTIRMLRWDGSGDDDDDYQEVWLGTARGESSDSPLWPLQSDAALYSDSTVTPPDFSDGNALFRVYVRTSDRLVLLAFRISELQEGLVRYSGRTATVEQFLVRDDVC